MRLRVALSVGGLLLLAGALNYMVVEHAAPGAGQQTLLVDVFASVAAVLLTLWLTARYEAGIKRIAAGLNEAARGRRDLRFDVDREPLVAHLAHAANDALGSLAEPLDPALGQVRVRKRSMPESKPLENEHSSEVGSAKPMLRASVETPAPARSTSSARLTPVPVPMRGDEDAHSMAPLPALEPSPLHHAGPPSSDVAATLPPDAVTERPRSAVPVGSSRSQLPTVLPPASPVGDLPTPAHGTLLPEPLRQQERFKRIYEEYRASLARLGEMDGLLPLESFLETLGTAEKSLMDKHGCRSVRFSVMVEGGRVQLLPRLVR